MRILHSADWHLGKSLEGHSRIPEQEAFIDEIVEIAEREKVDAIIIAGDVFDTVNPSAKAEELFYQALERLGAGGTRLVLAIAGNHDNPERFCAANPLALGQGIVLLGTPVDRLEQSLLNRYLKRADKVRVLQEHPSFLRFQLPSSDTPLDIGVLPYPSEARLKCLLTEEIGEQEFQSAYSANIQRIWDRVASLYSPLSVRLAVSHIYVDGSLESGVERPIQVGGAYSVARDVYPKGCQYLALGHLHRAQDIEGAGGRARYSGSPLAYSFSEVGQMKSVTLLTITPDAITESREIALESGRPLKSWEAKEGIDQVLRWCSEGRDKRAFIDLKVHCKQALLSADYRALQEQEQCFVSIRPIYETMDQQEHNTVHAMPLEEMFRLFYRNRRGGGEPPQEVVALFLEMLAEEGTQPQGGTE